jgi:ribonuclease HI
MDSTNNRSELIGVINGIKASSHNALRVFSDSAYIVNCFLLKWHDQWLRTNWKDGTIKNKDLWEELFKVIENKQIEWIHVYGHTGIQWNEYVDKLVHSVLK